jgi:hypothetical protein
MKHQLADLSARVSAEATGGSSGSTQALMRSVYLGKRARRR